MNISRPAEQMTKFETLASVSGADNKICDWWAKG